MRDFEDYFRESISMAILAIWASFKSYYEYQEANLAWKALSKLRSNSAFSSVKVIRDGHEQIIYARDLVLGDLVLLNKDQKVPADILIIKGEDCKADEMTITN